MALTVPIVSLAAADSAAAMREACTAHGFMLLADHGVPPEVIARQCEASRQFFALPLEKKAMLLATKDPNNRGYSPANEQRLDPTAQPDTKEGYYVGREEPGGPGALPLSGPNVWPPEEWCPGFSAAMMAYHRAMLDLSDRLLGVLEKALDLPAGWFAGKFDHGVATLRPLHYAPCEGDPGKGEFGAGAHTDFGCWTLLLTDEQPGLQLFYKEAWVDVPPRPDCFVMNIGDLLERWTNGRFKSTLHRVVNTGRERYSTAFFLDANFDTVVDCVPTCCGPDEPPRFPPITAGEHLLSCLKLTHTEHKLDTGSLEP